MNTLNGIEKLLAVMARLRDTEKGCPWDIAQDFATITKYTLEEVYEVVEAIERQDMAAVKEELGDLLFQIVFYAQMGKDKGLFDFQEIAENTANKMIARHPHVFEGKKLDDTEALIKMWESDKAASRAQKAEAEGRRLSVLDDVGTALPSLTRAVKLQGRAARVGFEWKNVDTIVEKLDEEVAELKEVIAERKKTQEPVPLELIDRLMEELGDVLFVAANIGRAMRIDAELALRHTNRKFDNRFRAVEKALAAKGKSPQESDVSEMQEIWNTFRANSKN